MPESKAIFAIVVVSLIMGGFNQPVSAAQKKGATSSFHGNAHWYGGHFHGKRTASGEVFDKTKLTAAHPSLPFGTKVRVKSLHTGKEVVVKVNDRCPALKVRCIDLSEGAAKELGIWPGAPGGVECVVLKRGAHSGSSEKTQESAEVADVAQPGM